MPSSDLTSKVQQFRAALEQLIERVREDRYVLGIVLDGSIREETVWSRNAIGIWIIEADGVTRRLLSDGEDESIYRILCEDGINMHAEVIPRARFRRMVEGASRTAFSCNFFSTRELVYSADPSLSQWFDRANNFAVKDRERELLTFSTWTMYAVRVARRRLEIKKDLDLARQEVIWAAHSVAHTEIIRSGNICEHDVIYRAIELNPELFQTIYLDVLTKRKTTKSLRSAIECIEGYLVEHAREHLRPLLDYLRKQDRLMPLSELSEFFAYSQLYPWHLEAACEWLEQQGIVSKLSAPFQLTKRSRSNVEEPAYYLDSSMDTA